MIGPTQNGPVRNPSSETYLQGIGKYRFAAYPQNTAARRKHPPSGPNFELSQNWSQNAYKESLSLLLHSIFRILFYPFLVNTCLVLRTPSLTSFS